MNYKEFFKYYCPGYNWVNNKDHKIYCSPHCPHFIGLSKKIPLNPVCEIEEEKFIKEYFNK